MMVTILSHNIYIIMFASYSYTLLAVGYSGEMRCLRAQKDALKLQGSAHITWTCIDGNKKIGSINLKPKV